MLKYIRTVVCLVLLATVLVPVAAQHGRDLQSIEGDTCDPRR